MEHTLTVKFLRGFKSMAKTPSNGWYDLRVGEDITLTGRAYIPLGLSVEFPKGYICIVAPKEKVMSEHGLLKPEKYFVVDREYMGGDNELYLTVTATRTTHLKKGELIARLKLFKEIA